jgi:hypothetical protein
MTAIRSWDRQKGFVPASSEFPTGDCYVCWNPDALYLATYVIDVVESDYYKDGKIPDADRAVWQIQINGQPPITAIVGMGKEPGVNDPKVRVASLSGIYHNVRCITAIEYPAAKLGRKQFAAGDKIHVKSNFATFGRAQQIDWEVDLTLSK